jgi:tRNA(Phe) wybutosine-synthesizing methylase Tyw3
MVEDLAFNANKARICAELYHTDKSPKGSVDIFARPVIDFINEQPDFFTTSSCSGRIAIYCYESSGAETPSIDAPSGSNKGHGKWLYVNHGPEHLSVAAVQASMAAAPAGTSAYIKTEPFLLHVQCRTLDAARLMLQASVAAGYRESGIGISNANKIIVGIRTTALALEAPLRSHGVDLYDDNLLQHLVHICNERMVLIHEKRARYFDSLRAALTKQPLLKRAVPTPAVLTRPSPASTDVSRTTLPLTSTLAKSVACSACGAEFSSKNQLYRDHLVRSAESDSSGRAVCPVASSGQQLRSGGNGRSAIMTPEPGDSTTTIPVGARVLDGEGTAAVGKHIAPGSASALLCATCGVEYKSRNQLFKHLKDQGSLCYKMNSLSSKDQATNAVGVVQTAADSSIGRWARSVAVQYVQSLHDRTDRTDRTSRTQASTASANLAHKNYGPETLLRWRLLSGSDAACADAVAPALGSLLRYGHTAVLFNEKPRRAGHGLACLFGGVVAGKIHGRQNDVCVFDTGTHQILPTIDLQPSDARRPCARTRHASAAFLSSAGPGHWHMLTCGGHNGPLSAQGDAWVLTVHSPAAATGPLPYSYSWTKCNQSGDVPSPRWGHSLQLISAPSDVSHVQMLLFGGRDADKAYSDVYLATVSVDNNAAAECDVVWQRVSATGASVPLKRYYHAATAVGLDDGGADGILVHGGLAGVSLTDAAEQLKIDNSNLYQTCGLGQRVRILGDMWYFCILTRTWKEVHSFDGLTPSGRFSHTLVQLPRPAQGEPLAANVCVMISGGEAVDTANNQSFMNFLRFDGGVPAWSGWTACVDNGGYNGELTTDTTGPEWPFFLRASVLVTRCPDNEDCQVWMLGGGGVCFAFGSYFSRPCALSLPTAALNDLHVDVLHRMHSFRASASAAATSAPLRASSTTASSPMQAYAILVPSASGERARTWLKERGLFDETRVCMPVVAGSDDHPRKGKCLAVPVDGELIHGAMHALTNAFGADCVLTTTLELPLFRGTVKSVTQRHRPGGGKYSAEVANLSDHFSSLVQKSDLSVQAMFAELLVPGTTGGMPRKVEWIGDIAVLPQEAFTDNAWLTLAAGRSGNAEWLWTEVAHALQCRRVARKAEVSIDEKRTSALTLVHPERAGGSTAVCPTAVSGRLSAAAAPLSLSQNSASKSQTYLDVRDRHALSAPVAAVVDPCTDIDASYSTGGWVKVKENGVTFCFDVTKNMFSTGNSHEKLRIARQVRAGELVVDLYAGIGYFTLPILVHAQPSHVHACDWNTDALLCLKHNLSLNQIPPGRCTLWYGDNATLVQQPSLLGTADRVLLGLIPSCEMSWPVAVQLLKPSGGTLHVHVNTSEAEIVDWSKRCAQKLKALSSQLRAATSGLVFSVCSINRVKSYAPRVYHFVVDIQGVSYGDRALLTQ